MINLNSINLSQSSSNAIVSPEQITNAVNNYLDNNPISSITTIYGSTINQNIESDGTIIWGQLGITDDEGNTLTQKQIQELENHQLCFEGVVILDKFLTGEYFGMYFGGERPMSIFVYEDSEDEYLYTYYVVSLVTSEDFKYFNDRLTSVETQLVGVESLLANI